MRLLAVGTVVIGPRPQEKSLMPEDTGEGINDWLVSPIPNVLLLNTGSGWIVSGAMVREMTIQSFPKCRGTTG